MDKHFLHREEGGGVHTFLIHRREVKTFLHRDGGGYDDVEEERDVSKVNFLVSEASKLSGGARIFRGHFLPFPLETFLWRASPELRKVVSTKSMLPQHLRLS